MKFFKPMHLIFITFLVLGSGKLELWEFIELTKAALDKHDPGAIQKAFDSFDINNDGYISADELRYYLC